jgi:glycosyltransferase involved in cell wall biosynthesis/SAM-dependent methyltransferase
MSQVSIVVPAFNSAATLDETIDSVLGQTFRDWELIIFNDGSVDTTGLVAAEKSRSDPRIRVASGENGGLASARNRGAAHATSPWLVFLDADDLITPEHLATMLKTASLHPTARLIYASAERMTLDRRMSGPEFPPQTQHFEALGIYNPFFVHGCMIHRVAFDTFGGFETSLATCEDWDLWQRLARSGVEFASADACLAIYRMRRQSLSRSAQTLFDCGRQVILRAHDSDPRVREPLDAYANGLPKERVGSAVLGLATWCSANMIGGSLDPIPFIENADIPPVSYLDRDRLVSMLALGVPNGACLLVSDWERLWAGSERHILRVLKVLEQRIGVANFASDVMSALAQRLKEYSMMSPGGSVSSYDKNHTISEQRTGLANFASDVISSFTQRLQKLASHDKHRAVPAVGKVNFGDLRRVRPIGTQWGYDRGTPIDRHYIESFLEKHRADVQGCVLEIGDNAYTMRFGGDRVIRSEILNADPEAKDATIIADLATADHIESNRFDCIILTQTLQYLFDLGSTTAHLHRMLKPGGVLLISVAGITPIGYDKWEHLRYWSLTPASMRKQLEQQFSASCVQVEARGNIFTAISFLHGLSQEDISGFEDQPDDPHFPVSVLARAVKTRS